MKKAAEVQPNINVRKTGDVQTLKNTGQLLFPVPKFI
jgi:hypothetical protein